MTTSENIKVPNEIVLMIEFRRAAFEYEVIANLIEASDFPKEKLIEILRGESKRFTKAHDDAQSRYAKRMENELRKED